MFHRRLVLFTHPYCGLCVPVKEMVTSIQVFFQRAKIVDFQRPVSNFARIHLFTAKSTSTLLEMKYGIRGTE